MRSNDLQELGGKCQTSFFLRHMRHEYEPSPEKAIGEAILSIRVRFASGNKGNI